MGFGGPQWLTALSGWGFTMSSEFLAQVTENSKGCRRALGWLLFLCCCVIPTGIQAQLNPIRRVLVFYEVGAHYPAIALIDHGLSETLRNSPYQIEVYREYLDTALFPDPATQREFREWYTRKYRDRKPDVIIAAGPSALEFMLTAHEAFFRDIPVVFCFSTEAVADRARLDSYFTGVWDEPEPAKALETSLRLRPGTKHVFLVGGTSPYDRTFQRLYRERLQSFESELDFKYLTDLAMPQLLDRLRRLPDHSVVLYLGVLRDAAGTQFIDATEAGPMVAQAANAPVFTLADINLGHGEAGGDVINVADEGRVAGTTALRILGGEKPQDIPIARTVNSYKFDWRALKRWGIRESDLPAGSIVLNRQPSFWELYKQYVLVGILILLAQAMAILGLLWQRARRRKMEVKLRKSEQKFSKSFRHSPLAISIASAHKDRYLEVNETFEELTGWRQDEVAGRSHSEIKLWEDPEHRSAFLKQLLALGSARDLEIRIRRKDGQIRTTLGSAELIEVDGENCCLSVWADITERKQAEEALAGLSHKLIEAQEKERARIARELHDDINQRIALLAVELEQLQQSNSGLDGEVRRRMIVLGQHITEIGIEVQSISHRLHSSKLELLGVVAACRSFCREVAERNKVTVDFAADGGPQAVPQDVSLCVFRILQESLNNAIKHSGTEHFEVRLRGVSDEIQLTVRDCGVGFDAPAALSGHGLGLISMRERASLVKGTIFITSKPMRGTDITLRVPIAVNRESPAISGAA
jgi:PAS domain S-box-containing protein